MSSTRPNGNRVHVVHVIGSLQTGGAEKMLLKTALVEIGTLDTALRKVERSPQGFNANFIGLTEQNAELACRRLEAQNVPCRALSPG